MSSDIKFSQVERFNGIYNTRDIAPGSRDKLVNAASISAFNNNRTYEGCARCVLAGINEHLHLGSKEGFNESIKASTALSAGVARMGETCGALIGGVMALGLEFGSGNMSLFDTYADTMQISKELFSRFKELYGTVKCSEIQENVLGRRYNFYKEEDRDAWYSEGGLEKCPSVCAAAAGIATEIILDRRNKI